MQVAIIGAGKVGTPLGRRGVAAGDGVVYGVRVTNDPKHAALAYRATVADAVASAEVVVLTTPRAGAESAIAAAGDFPGTMSWEFSWGVLRR